MQDYIGSRVHGIVWGKERRDEVEDVVIGDADRDMVSVDVNWGWVCGCGGDEGGEGGGDFPRGVPGVFC